MPGSRHLAEGWTLLSPVDSRALWNAADLNTVRNRYRLRDPFIFGILTDLAKAVEAAKSAELGSIPRQESASENNQWWTPKQLGKRAGRGERTVRIDCEKIVGTMAEIQDVEVEHASLDPATRAHDFTQIAAAVCGLTVEALAKERGERPNDVLNSILNSPAAAPLLRGNTQLPPQSAEDHT